MRKVGVLLGCALLCAGCGGGARNAAQTNRTFYQYDEATPSQGDARVERPYPALDAPGVVGVSLLDDAVRVSRPSDWRIRRASLAPRQRFVEYVSPKGYLVAIYERTDPPGESWRDVLGRYEEGAKAKGAEVLGRDIPVTTRTAQGREYVVRRSVKGQRAPYVNTSWEILLRGRRRIALVEIVQEGPLSAPPTEVLPVFETVDLQ